MREGRKRTVLEAAGEAPASRSSRTTFFLPAAPATCSGVPLKRFELASIAAPLFSS